MIDAEAMKLPPTARFQASCRPLERLQDHGPDPCLVCRFDIGSNEVAKSPCRGVGLKHTARIAEPAKVKEQHFKSCRHLGFGLVISAPAFEQ